MIELIMNSGLFNQVLLMFLNEKNKYFTILKSCNINLSQARPSGLETSGEEGCEGEDRPRLPHHGQGIWCDETSRS